MFSTIFFYAVILVAIWCAYRISVTDFRRRIIPDVYLFPLLLAGLILSAFYAWPCDIKTATIGAVFGYTMSAIIGIIFDIRLRRRDPNIISPIGMGDIKVLGVGGLWLGTTGLAIALLCACILGGMWSHRKHQKYIPFAPFFVCGGILALIAITFLL
jgi:prepilin signal peptidase PulO-like enzyme (type II secretory pathway)